MSESNIEAMGITGEDPWSGGKPEEGALHSQSSLVRNDGSKKRGLILWGLITAILFAAFLAPRLIGIKKFTTGDEPAWVIFSHNYLHALDQRQFERTSYDYQPAITTMWMIVASIVSYFPEYTSLRHGYIEKFWVLEEIYQKAGKAMSTVLFRSRMIYVALISAVLLLTFILLRKLLGSKTALVAILLVAFNPFYLGQSRLLNHEGLASIFVLAAALSMLVFLNKGEKRIYLLISGACSGLALLTKSPAILLIPLTGLMLLVGLVENWVAEATPKELQRGKLLWNTVKNYLIWLGVLAAVYFIIWPGMWVNPLKMLYEVYGNALSYTFQGQRLLAAQELEPSRFSLDASGIGFYLTAMLYKTTPMLWVGVILSICGLLARKTARMERATKQTVGYLLLLAALYVLLFGMARGWNSMHYVLISFICLEVIAGIGFCWGASWLGEKIPSLARPAAQAVLLGAVVLLQGLSGVPQYPYYYTYTNPVMQALQPGTQDPSAGYGEGLELAAEYLAQKPGAENLMVTSYLGIGPFSYHFPGTSHPLMFSSMDYLNERSAEWVVQSDYLVIYDIMQRQFDLPSELLAALVGVPPEHVIVLNSIPYASIYKNSELPDRVFDSLLPAE
jgi:4-amino-4-deoxy-L-arabinose transferase-like glycosyltransferase